MANENVILGNDRQIIKQTNGVQFYGCSFLHGFISKRDLFVQPRERQATTYNGIVGLGDNRAYVR